MSELNLKDIKEKLIAERENLLKKLKENDLSVDDSETPDPVDLAVRNYSKNVMLAVSENDSRQINSDQRSVRTHRRRRIRHVPKLRKRNQAETSRRDSVGALLSELSGTCRKRSCWKKINKVKKWKSKK